MYATEFQTIINEPYIKIPEYDTLKGKNVRVLFLVENEEENQVNKGDAFDFIEYYANNPVKLDEDITFLSREEANER